MLTSIATALVLVLSPNPAAAAKPAGKQLVSHLRAVTQEVRVESHLTADDVKTQLRLDCGDAALKRFEPEPKAEADALLADASKLVEESIARDWQPAFKGNGSDYAVLARQIRALGESTAPGVKHHELLSASTKLRHAQVVRNEEVGYDLREIAAMRPQKYDCEDGGLEQAAFALQGHAEFVEKDVLDTLQFALRQKGTAIHAARPETFKMHATLTVTEATKMVMPTEPGFCGETGTTAGTATESADFPPFTVSPTGAVDPISTSPLATVGGSWSLSGSYAGEGQCQALTTFACNGGFAPILEGPPYSSLAITAEDSAAARAQVGFPQIQESGLESCPGSAGSSLQAYVPLPFIAHELAAHADVFAFAIDGSALRGRFEPLTVEEGIEHLGPALPSIDCHPTFSLSATCSSAGSHIHVVIKIEPVGD
jgi:hypothetical protein